MTKYDFWDAVLFGLLCGVGVSVGVVLLWAIFSVLFN